MMSKFMIVLVAASAAQQNNRNSEEAKELKQLQTKSTAELNQLKTEVTTKVEEATEANSKAFAELQKVCQEAADKYAVNLSGDQRGTKQVTKKGANGEDIQIFMGQAARRAAAARRAKAKLAQEIQTAQSSILRIVNATQLYNDSHANCKACLESQDQEKCDGITEEANKAKKEKVLIEKIIDETEDVEEESYDVGMESSSASNLLVAFAFLF
jgi:hypothetical protein